MNLTLRDALLMEGKEINIRDIRIDKNADLKGRPAIKVEFVMDGKAEKDLSFEGVITDDLSMSNMDKAELFVINASRQASNFAFDYSEEKGVE